MNTLPRFLALATLVAAQEAYAQDPAAKPPEKPQVPVPAGFALIPAGEFMMGDALDGDKDAPQHKVNVSAFYMQKTEVTMAQWDEVRAWGALNGYIGLATGAGKAADHPVQTIPWDQAVKWCNAKSEKEGLTPCYYTDVTQTEVYRIGDKNLTNAMVKWSANGYRLPTEAEWEKAARGGLSGQRFPWGNTVSHEQANFRNDGKENYQNGSTGFHPAYAINGDPCTSPVGSFAANGYGLFDMAGNVWEWCWDLYDVYSAASQVDPRGPATGQYGSDRVIRGGSWSRDAVNSRCADRGLWARNADYDVGFRLARCRP